MIMLELAKQHGVKEYKKLEDMYVNLSDKDEQEIRVKLGLVEKAQAPKEVIKMMRHPGGLSKEEAKEAAKLWHKGDDVDSVIKRYRATKGHETDDDHGFYADFKNNNNNQEDLPPVQVPDDEEEKLQRVFKQTASLTKDIQRERLQKQAELLDKASKEVSAQMEKPPSQTKKPVTFRTLSNRINKGTATDEDMASFLDHLDQKYDAKQAKKTQPKPTSEKPRAPSKPKAAAKPKTFEEYLNSGAEHGLSPLEITALKQAYPQIHPKHYNEEALRRLVDGLPDIQNPDAFEKWKEHLKANQESFNRDERRRLLLLRKPGETRIDKAVERMAEEEEDEAEEEPPQRPVRSTTQAAKEERRQVQEKKDIKRANVENVLTQENYPGASDHPPDPNSFNVKHDNVNNNNNNNSNNNFVSKLPPGQQAAARTAISHGMTNPRDIYEYVMAHNIVDYHNRTYGNH
jgi:hypothetical protein